MVGRKDNNNALFRVESCVGPSIRSERILFRRLKRTAPGIKRGPFVRRAPDSSSSFTAENSLINVQFGRWKVLGFGECLGPVMNNKVPDPLWYFWTGGVNGKRLWCQK
ncbi:hypothetical protein NPIL_208091 [Nephila pilipes]|uniref:Uncharacterized protein n=1 Tax=Nephila pilipes TaxID=299642 RepID=A0A8X6TCT7_NEPPI|nr:hypothetical protein NPIL_208091 [Nephila pilipes]